MQNILTDCLVLLFITTFSEYHTVFYLVLVTVLRQLYKSWSSFIHLSFLCWYMISYEVQFEFFEFQNYWIQWQVKVCEGPRHKRFGRSPTLKDRVGVLSAQKFLQPSFTQWKIKMDYKQKYIFVLWPIFNKNHAIFGINTWINNSQLLPSAVFVTCFSDDTRNVIM
jgi:hypothetical protein